MADYEQTLRIACSPAKIFDFVAKIENLPKYLPTTHDAQSQGQDRVRVQGEAHEHRYDSDGFLRADRERQRLEWGADEGYYAGWLQITQQGQACDVTVHLRLDGMPAGGKLPPEADIEDGLAKGLRSIQNHCEGTGGKEEPAAAT